MSRSQFTALVEAARGRFATGDPPIRSFHVSGPSKPLPDPSKTRVWFWWVTRVGRGPRREDND